MDNKKNNYRAAVVLDQNDIFEYVFYAEDDNDALHYVVENVLMDHGVFITENNVIELIKEEC